MNNKSEIYEESNDIIIIMLIKIGF